MLVLRPNEQMQLWHVTKVQRSLPHVRFPQGFYLVGFSELWKKVSLQLVAIGWSGELGVWHLRHTRCLLGLRRVWTVLSRDKARIHDDSHDHHDEPRLPPLAVDFLDTLSGFTWTWTDASTSWINGLRWADKIQNIQKGSSKTKHETHPTMLCNVSGLESLPAVSRCWRTCLMFCKTSWTRGRSTGRPRCRSKALHSPARTLCWLSCFVYFGIDMVWFDIMYHNVLNSWDGCDMSRHLLPCTPWFHVIPVSNSMAVCPKFLQPYDPGSPGSSFGFALWKRFSLALKFSGWLGCPSPYIWILGSAVYAV